MIRTVHVQLCVSAFLRFCVFAFCALIVLGGCQTSGNGPGRTAFGRTAAAQPIIRYVRCIYNHRPWLNMDSAGDRDPEGIQYRVFLDPGTGVCVHAEGTFHIEMYRIERTSATNVERTLVSDWHYPTSAFSTIAKPGMLGNGYYLQLRWASKDTAGHEIEMITRFEDPEGNVARSGTKRFRVPKHAS